MGTRDKRKGRAKTEPGPIQNDWAYACPRRLPTPAIAEALDVIGQPITEVSASTWQQDWQMANTFMEVYAYPKTYWFRPGEPVHWDAFNDWMLARKTAFEFKADGRVGASHFVGELVIVRQSWEAAENTLAFLFDIVQASVDWTCKQHHGHARIVLVLEGWERPTVTGKVGKRGKQVEWVINALPQHPVSEA